MTAAFEGAGQTEGLEIWRIENFEAVPFKKEDYGKFYTGDSYIILKTIRPGNWHIHFWLGQDTSQDEAGTAAIKSIELDDILGGSAIQHREVQGHESPMFLSYFKKGVHYLPGGVATGFKHVDPDDVVKRLFQVKGKRQVKVKQVPLDGSLINRSDCWILDCGKGNGILVFMPQGAGKMERFRATQAANHIRDDDHAGNATVEILSELSGGHLFYNELGIDFDSIPETSGEDDVDFEMTAHKDATLFKVSDASGDLSVTKIGSVPLQQKMLDASSLDPNDCFILDTGKASGIFVWVGKGATKEERIHSMKVAEEFLKKSSRPSWTTIERVVQGAETAIFKQYFHSWKDSGSTILNGLKRRLPLNTVAEWKVDDLHVENRKRIARLAKDAVGFSPDDSKGQKDIYRVEDFDLVPVDPAAHGFFFGGDSYVIKYTYQRPGGRSSGYIVYFWQGKESSADEKGASAIQAVKMDDELKGKATQVRVVQGHEPLHFIKMFGGKMVVFSGGKASGFRNVEDHDTYDKDGVRLFRVRGGSGEDDVRTEQVQPELASSLNSDDVFVLDTPTHTWVWQGQGSSDQEKSAAVQVVAPLLNPNRPAQVLAEGSEPDEFWTCLKGKADYPKSEPEMDGPVLEPRLFHCKVSEETGKFRAFEVMNFEQDDMCSDDIMILDTGNELYLWVGKEATEEEKQSSLKLAQNYLAADPTYRNETNTNVFVVKQGREPDSFKCVFPSFKPWDQV